MLAQSEVLGHNTQHKMGIQNVRRAQRDQVARRPRDAKKREGENFFFTASALLAVASARGVLSDEEEEEARLGLYYC